MMRKGVLLFVLFIASFCLSAQNYKLPETPVTTPWVEKITPENVHQEYPRPQLKRVQWKNLNGLWNYAVAKKEDKAPNAFEGPILVPFAIQTPLSGVEKELTKDDAIWYQRTLTIPAEWEGKHVLLNFEASDWETTVWVNDMLIGKHTGGYHPFSMDITDALQKTQSGEQNLIVKVWDHQGTLFTSEGKQASKEYLTVSGLWQTVWMEPVEKAHIDALKITTDMQGNIQIEPRIAGASGDYSIQYIVLENENEKANATSDAQSSVKVSVDNPRLWSPDSPFLYTIKAKLFDGEKVLDEVTGYAGLRTVELVDSEIGKQVYLNGKRIFQMGPLDQNYWPGGGLTAPSDEANAWEIQYLKDIGCNMVRLHIKQNARRWYYHCDRLGLLVWQDFICGTRGKGFNQVSFEGMATWMDEQKRIVENLYSHPSIVMWIVFNEAWGQHNTKEVLDWAMTLDPTRLFSVASGWYDLPKEGNVRDIHDYTFRPAIPALGTDPNRVVVLGECGGFASAVPPHNWTGRKNTDTQPKNPLHGGFDPTTPRDDNKIHDIFRPTFTAGKAFEEQYSDFVDNLVLLQNNGLVGAIYTQLTDMELEENGYLTYDRKVSKMNKEVLHKIHSRLYNPLPSQTAIIPSGLDGNTEWFYTTAIQKNNEWANPNSSREGWTKGTAPFVKGEVPGYKVGTAFDSDTLYLARQFQLNEIPQEASFRIYTYLEGKSRNEWNYAQIFINGVLVKDESTRQFMPELRVAEVKLHPEDLKLLVKGENTIAIKVKPNFATKEYRMTQKGNVLFDFSFMEVEKVR